MTPILLRAGPITAELCPILFQHPQGQTPQLLWATRANTQPNSQLKTKIPTDPGQSNKLKVLC